MSVYPNADNRTADGDFWCMEHYGKEYSFEQTHQLIATCSQLYTRRFGSTGSPALQGVNNDHDAYPHNRGDVFMHQHAKSCDTGQHPLWEAG